MTNLQAFFSEPIAFLYEAFFRMTAVLIALCCHEWGHAYAACRCGDDTAKRAGRLTLNPLKHLDPIGTVCMLFFGFGWAKPVPVNPWNYRGDKRKCDLWVSIAGIAMNLILFALFTYLLALVSVFMWDRSVIDEVGLSTVVSFTYMPVWTVMQGTAGSQYAGLIAASDLLPVARLLALTSLINLNLAVFNILPIPPLDGFHVLNDLVLRGRLHLSRRVFQVAMVAVIVLASMGAFGRVISAVIGPAQDVLLWPIRLIWG